MQEFHNRSALALWVFMALWMAMLCAFSWLMVRDGPPAAQPTLSVVVLAMFWLAGVPLTRHLFAKPLIFVRAGSRRRLWIRRRWLLRVEERQIGAQVPVHAQVIRDTDSDGDPYFRVRLSIAGDGDLDLWEGHDGTQAEAELSRLLRAWGQAANRPSSAPTRLPG
ncbi:MAG: hypothetical protein U1F26_12660 [Lysobacterales bacterium]